MVATLARDIFAPSSHRSRVEVFNPSAPRCVDPEVVLARQLAMNRETWAVLQSHGVTDKTELRLDFNYKAAYRERADELAGFLREATDYEVRADDASVSGTTPATSLSLEILDEWVTWMVRTGHAHGRCEFDGKPYS